MSSSGSEQDLSGDEAQIDEVDRRQQHGLGSDIDPTSASAVLQLQVQDLVADTIAANRRLRKASNTVISSLEELFKPLKTCKLHSTGQPSISDWFTVKPFQMDFLPPNSIELTGPLLYGCATIPRNTIQVTIELPRKALLAKDYLNHKYHARRLLYLQHVAGALQASDLPKRGVQIKPRGSDLRCPCLHYIDEITDVSVLVSTSLPSGTFQCSKLAPARNCLRGATHAAKGSSDPQPAATPIYNDSILSELLHHNLCTELAQILASPRLQAVACLCHKFLTAQVPDSLHLTALLDGILAVLASAVQHGKVTEKMTVVQVFRAVLTLIAAPGSPKFALQATPETDAAAPSVAEHAATSPCVFLDSSQYFNMLAGVPVGAWRAVQAAAACTLAALSGAMGLSGATIGTLFQPSRCPVFTFDAVARVEVPPVATDELFGSDAPWSVCAAQKAEGLLKTALSDRVFEVTVMQQSVGGVALNGKGEFSGLPGITSAARLMVGVILNPFEAYRLLDRGPPAASVRACAAFRKLWGDRAELRRLPDASIHEAVAWDSVAPHQRCAIPDLIVKHILETHLPGCEVRGTALMLHPALEARGVPADETAVYRSLDAAVHTLCQRLKQLQGLSLAVVSTQSIGAPCRHTACFPPQAHPLLFSGAASATAGGEEGPLPRCVSPATVLVQVEGSGKWPDDDVAAGKLRAALGCQTAQALESQFGLSARAAEAHVDVHVQGFAVRLKIWSNRDDALADRAKMGLKLKKDVRKLVVSKQGLDMLQQRLQVAHHGLMTTFIGENPSASRACRFAKRWISSQMLSYHIADEAVELIVAAAYTSISRPYKPTSALAGFMRFLHLLSQHEWQSYPLLCDPAKVLKNDEVKAALKAHRDLLPTSGAPPCCLMTPYDLEGSAWTKERPAAVMVTRMRRLAASSLECMSHAVVGDGQRRDVEAEEICGKVFACDLDAFDALAMLRSEALPHSHLTLQPSPLELWSHSLQEDMCTPQCISDVLDMGTEPSKRSRAVLSSIPRKARKTLPAEALRQDVLVGIDPIANLMERLEQHLGHCGIFTADEWGGNVIGIKWKPKAFVPGPLRVPIAHTLAPVPEPEAANGGDVQYAVDKAVVLQEVIHCGEGIIDDAVLRRGAER